MTPSTHPVDPEMVMALLDGELTDAEAGAVRAHVRGCAACGQLAGELALLSPRLAAWSVEPAPATLAARGGARRWRNVLRRWGSALTQRPAWAIAGVSAAAVVLAAIAWQGGRAINRPSMRVAIAEPVSTPILPAESLRVGASRSVAFSTQADAAGESLAADRLVVTSVTLHVVTREFDRARATLERTVRDAGGFVGEMSIRGTEDTPRFLNGTIRVPAAALESTLAALRGVGQVQEESRRADDVTEGVRDVEARLVNARAAEQRIVEILARRTGSLNDVLAAERELARMRAEIERLQADRQNVLRQVQFAAIRLEIRELRPESLQVGHQPLSWRLRDAFVRGVRGTAGGLSGMLLFVVGILPPLLLLGLALAPVAVVVLRRRRARAAVKAD